MIRLAQVTFVPDCTPIHEFPITSHEVLAPAGSFEALTTAIQAGADAAYFGIEQLNTRAARAVKLTGIVKGISC